LDLGYGPAAGVKVTHRNGMAAVRVIFG